MHRKVRNMLVFHALFHPSDMGAAMAVSDEIKNALQNSDLLFTEPQVEEAIDKMADEITKDLADTNPIVFSVMNGGLVLTGKLVTKLGFPLEISYLHATRYRNQTNGRELEWRTYPQQSLEGRNVLIVDDIHDEGHTLAEIVKHCNEANVASVKVAVLVEKLHDRKAIPGWLPDYVGLECEDRYIYGYGMDLKGYWRNAPGIYALKGM